MAEGLGNHCGPKLFYPYCTTAGPEFGPFRRRDALEKIDVLDAQSGEMIGVANRLDEAPAGVAMWRLVTRGVEIEGRWNVVGRDFCGYDSPPPAFGPSETAKP
jgi:hypothetical protein